MIPVWKSGRLTRKSFFTGKWRNIFLLQMVKIVAANSVTESEKDRNDSTSSMWTSNLQADLKSH